MKWNDKTKTEWDTQINAYKFEDVWHDVLLILYPGYEFEDNSAGEFGEDLYNQIKPYQMVGQDKVYEVKLPYNPNVTDALTTYKVIELRKIDQRFRFLNLFDWRGSANDSGVFMASSNPDLVADLIVKNDMETELALMETQDALIKAVSDYEVKVDEKEARLNLGKRIVANVLQMNEDNNITPTQIATVFADLEVNQVMTSLSVGSLLTAQSIMNAKDLTGLDPFDQSYKDKINQMINDYFGV